MKVPTMASTIERRLLVNYRLDPAAAAAALPDGLRPEIVHGYAVGGICLIRLAALRPSGLPGWLGVRTENAAHRIAVVWNGPDGPQRGVYIPRRDTSSRLTTSLAGRLFPGEHHHAAFSVQETADRIRIGFRSDDGGAQARVEARIGVPLRGSVLFDDTDAASRFFRGAPLGFSARSTGPQLDGVALDTDGWRIESAELVDVASDYFSDPRRFPRGTSEPDSALLMRGIAATWTAQSAPEMASRGC
jgi:hypothetical protein